MDNCNWIPKLLMMTPNNKSQSVSIGLLIAVAIASFSPAAIAKPVTEPSAQSPASLAEIKNGGQNANLSPDNIISSERLSPWATLWKLLTGKREREPLLAARGPVCTISPGVLDEKNRLWGDRPLFVWQRTGYPTEIRLYRPFNPDREREVLWSKIVTAEFRETKFTSVPYTGELLQRGQTYDWELVLRFSEESAPKKLSYSFQVMGTPESQEIATDMEALTSHLKETGATAEEIALERANYFARLNLWSDALQELYSVQDPSTTLSDNIQKIAEYLCEPGQPDGSPEPPR